MRRGYADLPGLLEIMSGDEKHELAAHSTLDVIWVLYDRILRVSPETVGDPDRDRFLLSKGHGPMAYYAVLAAKGFITTDDLERFGSFDGRLGHHPDRNLVPGVEISSGSLGHGLPMAIGLCLGLHAQGRDAVRVVCLVGDAELDEGSNWEAIALAGRLGLGQLTLVAVDNRSTSYPWPIAPRLAAEGWSAVVADGRDHDALERAFGSGTPGRPHAVVATIGDGQG